VKKPYPSLASLCGDILASQHLLEVSKLFKGEWEGPKKAFV